MTEIETEMKIFQLPIFYNEKKRILKQNIIKDLELVHTENEDHLDKEKSVYHHVFNLDLTNKNLKNVYLDKMVEKMTEYYTTDIDFLKDYQTLFKKYKPFKDAIMDNAITENENIDLSTVIDSWREIKEDTGFKEKYFYIDWSIWEFLNKSELFLQIMSIYNLSAPVLSLLLPVFILIIPFFIIQMKGLEISINEYFNILKIIASNHAFGKLFTEFHSVEMNQKIYLIVSALFYVFSIYQNFLLCIRFHMNMSKIHDYIQNIKKYIHHTLLKIDQYLSYSTSLTTHGSFNRNLKEKHIRLSNLYDKLDKIHTYQFSIFSIGSWNKIFEIGYVLKCFYEFYDEVEYQELMEYSFEFHTYLDCIEGIQENISKKQICFAEFQKREKKEKKGKREKKGDKEKEPLFKDNYYAVLKDDNPIKNTVSMDKNLILTGPNASGKTTVLKSILINILLTQQFGCGFYSYAYFKPYDYIHCYLNIPDTSGRDSLFQAEAKRCKEILESVEENKEEERHFCAFDEIYSGTNPEEATLSTVAFIDYLVKYKNISCVLTSHFIKACKKLGKNKRIENFHMDVEKSELNSSIKYTYELKKGISTVQGGIQILKDMNYPQKILDQTQFVNSKI